MPATLAGTLLLAAFLCQGSPASARGALDGLTAIAATPYGGGVPGGVVARFGNELPIALRRAGFSLLDPRQVDVKLAERPDLLLSCQDNPCFLAQAELLSVAHLIVPQLRQGKGRLLIELVLYDDTQEAGKQVLTPVSRAQETCLVGELSSALTRAVVTLKKGAEQALFGEVAVNVLPEAARVFIDGEEIGTGGQGTLRRPVPPGDHLVEARGPAGRAERRVSLSAGQHVSVDLLATGPEPAPALLSRRRPLQAAKWATFGVGMVAIIAGTTLWALNGTGTCDKLAGQTHCHEVLDTFPLGVAVLSEEHRGHAQRREGESAAILTFSGAF